MFSQHSNTGLCFKIQTLIVSPHPCAVAEGRTHPAAVRCWLFWGKKHQELRPASAGALFAQSYTKWLSLLWVLSQASLHKVLCSFYSPITCSLPFLVTHEGVIPPPHHTPHMDTCFFSSTQPPCTMGTELHHSSQIASCKHRIQPRKSPFCLTFCS